MATTSSSNGPPPSDPLDDVVVSSSMDTISMSHSVEAVDAPPMEEEQGRQESGIGSLSEETSMSSGGGEAMETMANGIASVLGPVVRMFETRVDEVLKSQNTLQSSIERLTRELDKLLDDTPLPLGAQHAAKLSGIRKRVGSLTETLRIIQGRINSMDRMLSKESVGSLH
ncbi:unnamed protein product [Calypogeia fissa]